MIERINLNLTYKLLLLFLFFTTLAVVFQLFTTNSTTNKYIEDQSKDIFYTLTNHKREAIEEYFREKIYNLELLANTEKTKTTFLEIDQLRDTLKIRTKDPFNVRNELYIKIYNKHITYFTKFISTYGFEDIYIIDEENGQVLFSEGKKKDFGANIRYGNLKNSHLAEIWKQTIKTGRTNIIDFKPYEPSNNEMALFIATPLYIRDNLNENESIKAIVVVQLSPKQINNIIQKRNSSLQSTGETFLIGMSDQSKTELRSDRIIVPGEIGDVKNDKYFEAALIKGESGNAKRINNAGVKEYITYMPLVIKDLNWAIFTTIELQELYSPVDNIWFTNLFGGLILIIFTVLFGLYAAKKIAFPIKEIKDKLQQISIGILPNKKYNITYKDEIGDIQSAINELCDAQRKYIDFANNISENNINNDFEKLSENDMLGDALLRMKDSLANAEEVALNQKKEEEKQRWMTEGIAKFGDILRQNYDGLEILGDNIVKNLSEFLSIEQGGIFIYNDRNNEPKIELLACFAFDRKKYEHKTIQPGEGLVGACFNEKETIHLKNIPEDYPNIRSGMGSAKPKEALLIPLKIDNNVLGVIELVSFHIFKPQEIAFAEKIAESIASSIASSQINERTKLLLEESKMKSEQMSAQEEEMRQNMEELQATQEESERREAETSSIYEAFNKTVLISYFTIEGAILQINKNFLDILEMTENEVIGLEYKLFNDSVKSTLFWENLQNSNSPVQIESTVKTKSSIVTLQENYHVIKDSFGDPIKIINIAFVKS